MALPDPTLTADDNHSTSSLVCGHLVQAMRSDCDVTYSSVDHISTRKEVVAAVKERQAVKYEAKLKEITSKLDPDTARMVKRGRLCGQWLSVMPLTVNGTELSPQEFRDNLLLRQGRAPGDLPKHCDGCGATFTMTHALDCKVGGLIHQRHDEIKFELMEWASKALTPSAVRVEPLIHTDSTPDEGTKTNGKSKPEAKTNHHCNHSANDGQRGDVLVRGLFQRGTECIIDVRVTDLDSISQRSTDPDKVLRKHEKQKKSKYLQACLEQRRTFCPFVVSTDGVLGFEANCLMKRIAAKLAVKWKLPYSQLCGLVRARMSIAIARATHLCIRGSRIPASRTSNSIQWMDGAGVGLFKVDY